MKNETPNSTETPAAEQAPQKTELLFTYSNGVIDKSIALRQAYDGRWILTIGVDLYDDPGGDGVEQKFATRAEAVTFFANAVAEVLASL